MSQRPKFTRSFVKAKIYEMTLLHEGVFRQGDRNYYLSFEALQKVTFDYNGQEGLAPLYMKYATPSGNHDFLESEQAEQCLVGYVERLYINTDGWLTARVLVNTAEAIDLIDNRGWKQSIGYVIAEEEPMETADGIEVESKITRIGFDHILITDKPKYKGVSVVTCDEDDSANIKETSMNTEEEKPKDEVTNTAPVEEEKKEVTDEQPAKEEVANTEEEKVEDTEEKKVEDSEGKPVEDKKEIGADEDYTCQLADGRTVGLSELRACYVEHNPKPDEIIINGKVVTNDEALAFVKSKLVTNSDPEKKADPLFEKLKGLENKMLAQKQKTTPDGLIPFNV